MEASRDALTTELTEVEAVLRSTLGLNEIPATEFKTHIGSLLSTEDKRAQDFQALAEEWLERFRLTAEFRLALLFRAQIVASTCVALTGSRGADRVSFDLCIVDEASKATPTELMVPMASARRWALVGDERQLPPFIESELKQHDILERFDLAPADVEERLFATLVSALPSESVLSLTTQHRMHPFIGSLVSDIFYDGRLTSSPRPMSVVMEKLFGTAAVWQDVDKRNSERRIGTSYSNRDEAYVVIEILKSLELYAAKLEDKPIEVAVLTGYLAQLRTLQELVSSSRSAMPHLQIRVATIDSFQGQEADGTAEGLVDSVF